MSQSFYHVLLVVWSNFSFNQHVLWSKFEKKRFQERKTRGEKEKKGENNRLQSTGRHNPHPEHRKYNFKFCSHDSTEIPELGGCSGTASFALVELIPITQRKMNCTEQTVGGRHVWLILLEKNWGTAPLKLRTLHKSQQCYGRAFNLHMRKTGKQNYLNPDFLCSRTVLSTGVQSRRSFVCVAFRNYTIKTGLSKNILKPEKIPSQIRETKAWSSMC